MVKQAKAFVDKQGIFHCPCGSSHNRGHMSAPDVWRRLNCGRSYKVSGVVILRTNKKKPYGVPGWSGI